MSTQAVFGFELIHKLRATGARLRESVRNKSVKDVKGIVQETWRDRKRRWILYIPIALFALLIGRWIYQTMSTESTDDAFVSAHVHTVGARVAGTVLEVPGNDNQIVKKGDLLIKLDPADFLIRQKIATANDTKARANLKKWGNRAETLHPNEEIQYQSDVADSLAAAAALEQAELNLKYSEVRAAEDGKIGNRAVETGQQVQPGQALMALVEKTPWVVANFKESQAARLRPGQEAEISVDAISGHTFKGHVDSIAPGSGATFSLLPPDNATGNFTKIVQRIPVKIVFDADSLNGFDERLAAGMSVAVTVHH